MINSGYKCSKEVAGAILSTLGVTIVKEKDTPKDK